MRNIRGRHSEAPELALRGNASGETAGTPHLTPSVATAGNRYQPPAGTIYGARRGVTFGPTPRTRITVHSDPGGPAFLSGRRFRRAKQRAERKGGAR